MDKRELSKNNFGKKGWLLVLYCFLAYFITTGAVDTMNLSYSIFSEMYEWNETLLLSLSSVGGYVSVIAIYVIGLLYATGKLKLKTTLLIAGVVFSVLISLWGV